MRLALAVLVVLVLAAPAGAAPATLARPDARVTLVASDVEVGALLRFLAAVGGTEVAIGPEVAGATRSVRFEHARVQDAFDQLLAAQGLQAAMVEGRLVIGRGPAASPSPLVPTPLPVRPELLVPPQPGR